MNYRAKNLPRLALAESSNLDLLPNMIVCDKSEKKVGSTVFAINKDNSSLCLISVKENYLNEPLFVKDTNNPLTIISKIN